MYQRDLSSQLESTAEEIALRKDGERLTVLLSSFPLAGPDGRPRRASFVLDITDRKRAELELSKRAEHDALTGLPNRLVFRDRLDQALAQASRDNDLVGLLFIDLDGFKPVNDRLGHDVGDLLLQQVAERLRQTIRHVDTVARLAGDEFTITLPSIASEQDAGMVAHKVLQAISEPYDLGAAVAQVTASIGVSIYPSDGADTDSLIKGADKAMYRAKNQGKNGVAFCSDNRIKPIAYT
jgi:diguanylate cyclase (GGDEF)-like protein